MVFLMKIFNTPTPNSPSIGSGPVPVEFPFDASGLLDPTSDSLGLEPLVSDIVFMPAPSLVQMEGLASLSLRTWLHHPWPSLIYSECWVYLSIGKHCKYLLHICFRFRHVISGRHVMPARGFKSKNRVRGLYETLPPAEDEIGEEQAVDGDGLAVPS